MQPAFSVIFLTVFIGAAQGLVIAAYLVDAFSHSSFWPSTWPSIDTGFYISAGVVGFLLLLAGLVASFFHLGRPERFWRAAAKWRTSWLSREVILLIVFIGAVVIYTAMHIWPVASGGASYRLTFGALTCLFAALLYVTTGMIYACIKFLPQWCGSITVVNFITLGLASGTTLALAIAVILAPSLIPLLLPAMIALTGLSLVVRVLQLLRNQRLRPKTRLASALGIHHNQIKQTSPGFMGGSFNTREFFHGKSTGYLRLALTAFLCLAFLLPPLIAILAFAFVEQSGSGSALTRVGYVTMAAVAVAAITQLAGIVIERWYFFADATHAQNNYYQRLD